MAASYRPSRLHQTLKLQPVSLRVLIEGIRIRLRERSRRQQVDWEVDIAPGLQASVDVALMATAVSNLIENSLDAMPEGGELTITACYGRHGLEVEVADSGPGLPQEMAERAFEPFVTNRPGRAGLGLSVAAEIVWAHHGEIVACACPEGGTAVTIRIPELQTQSHRAAA
jgi:signal transduction histidine kinase